ncbi:hypothetical protein LXL04_034431 [Taraxacum kok-saghyz]
MADEPSITRWSFQDFKMFYDIKFGRKKESTPKDAAANGQQPNGQPSSNGNSSNGTSNGNGHPNNTAELSIYEQYRQARENSTANGVTLPDAEKPKKSLLPAFESAEMRRLAESLSSS